MRERFLKTLESLNSELIEMGAMIESAIENAVKALMEQDEKLAREIIAFDDEINNKETLIEKKCLDLLLNQQPVASDFRMVSAAVKMITDMERIGDHAADISELTILLTQNQYISYVDKIPEIAQATIKMLNESIDAFVKRDLAIAEAVREYDDVVDDLFAEIKKDLITLIRTNPDSTEQAVDLIMIAKYFERIGDHAVNIAEWVIFSLTGDHNNQRVI